MNKRKRRKSFSQSLSHNSTQSHSIKSAKKISFLFSFLTSLSSSSCLCFHRLPSPSTLCPYPYALNAGVHFFTHLSLSFAFFPISNFAHFSTSASSPLSSSPNQLLLTLFISTWVFLICFLFIALLEHFYKLLRSDF